MKKNNKGFSLVELIIAFAIAAIAGMAVVSMMSMSNNSFRRSSRDVGLQYEQQIVVNQIRDFILESTDAISYDETKKALYVFSQGIITETESGTGNVVQKDSYEITELSFVKEEAPAGGEEPETGEIRYRTVGVTSIDGGYETQLDAEDKILLGEKVKDISYDLTQVEKGKVSFTITFLDEDKEFTSTQTVSLRNKIKNLDDLGEIYDTTRIEVNSFIEGIIILRDEEEMGATDEIGLYGNTVNVQYTAKVVTNRYSTRAYSVSWSVDGPANREPGAVSVNPSTGKVTILCDKVQNNDTFKLIATSVDDKTKFKELLITITNTAIYPLEAILTCDLQNVSEGNGYREYTLIPTINYSGNVKNKEVAYLTGNEALDRIDIWINSGDEFPGVKYNVVSGVDKNTGKLRLSHEANGKTFIISYTLKQKDVHGEVVTSNTVTITPEDIPEFATSELLLISAADQYRRGTTFNAMVSWKTNPGNAVKYYWKVVPYQDNTSAAWSPIAEKNARTCFDATVTMKETSYSKATNDNIGALGKLDEYVSDGKDSGVDDDGNVNTDDDVSTALTNDGWFSGTDPGRMLKVDVKSYLDWNNDYKVKILLFAYDAENERIYDKTGYHKPATDVAIRPLEKIVTIPTVKYLITPSNYMNNEYRYSDHKEEYKEFRTTFVLHPTKHDPGERRVFNGSTVGLYVEPSHSPLVNSNEGRNYLNHYIYYDNAEKVAVKNRKLTLPYMAQNKDVEEGNVDSAGFYSDRTQLWFNIDVTKEKNGRQTDFYKYHPNKMQFRSTLYQVNNVTFQGKAQTVINYAESSTYTYVIDYKLLED